MRLGSSGAELYVGLGLVVGLLLAALFLPLSHNPTTPDPFAITQAPGHGHLFGTDNNGFDVFSRTIASGRRDLPLALLGTLAAMAIGVPLGLVASSGRAGEALMRFGDAFAALPVLIISVVSIQLIGGAFLNILVVLATVNAPRFMRLTRGEALALRAARFVEAAVAIGCSPARVALNHVFRNAYGVVLAQAALTAANAIVVIAALNFLGVGVSPPTPTWGSMIQSGTASMVEGKWWVVLFPSLAIFVAVFGFNLIGDGLERRFEGHGA